MVKADDKSAPPADAAVADKDPTKGLTVRFVEGDIVQVEELQRVVLSSSPAWATLAFLARERDATTGDFRAPRVSLRRYKKRAGRYVVDKHFTLTTRAQALALAAAVGQWFDAVEGCAGGEGISSDDDDG